MQFVLRGIRGASISAHIERDVVDHDPARKGSQIGEEEIFKIIIDKTTGDLSALMSDRWPSLYVTYSSMSKAILAIKEDAARNNFNYISSTFGGPDDWQAAVWIKDNDEVRRGDYKPRSFVELAFALTILAIVVASALGLGFYWAARQHLHRNPPDTWRMTRTIKADVDPVTQDTTIVTITDKRLYIYQTLTNEQKKDLREAISQD